METRQLGGLTVRMVGGDDGAGGGDGPMVVLLHGFGAPGDDLVPLAGQLAVPSGTRFVFPEAPLKLPPEFGPGRAWWMIDMMRLQMAMMTGQMRDLTNEVPAGLPAARQKMVALLAALQAEMGMRPDQLVIGGFSQGAMLASDVSLRSEQKPAGLAIMSGTYLAADEWRAHMDGFEDVPVLMSHGRDDPLLPFAVAEQLRNDLVAAGAAVTWVPFDGGHGIAPSVLRGLAGVIATALGSD